MDTASPSQRTAIRFGVFEVDYVAGELRKQGIRIKLQGQPFQVLQILLERPGQIVTREQLRQRIWPADTFVDFEGGVSNAVKRLREALGDTAENPRFIETLPRRGYRFIGTINENQPATPADGSSPAVKRPNVPLVSRRGLRTLSVIGLGLVALVIVILALVPRSWRQHLLGASDVPAIHSLAVLPLQNLSGDPAQDYFADGMTEELITKLSGISALTVISRTSIMRYKRTDRSLPEIARELNVDAVVEGSVIRSGDRVRITAQLIAAPQDKNLWADTYDRDIQNVLELQAAVATAIVNQVQVKMRPRETALLKASQVVNPRALDSYLHGVYECDRYGSGFDQAELQKAITYFRQAIAEDPNFARAYLTLVNAVWAGHSSKAEVAQEVKSAVEKALAADPNLAEAHMLMAKVNLFDWDFPAAEREYKRAIELEPNYSDAHFYYGWYLDYMGRLDEGMFEQQRAQELDPAWVHLFEAFYTRRQWERAAELAERDVAMHPTTGYARLNLANAYRHVGKYKQSIEEVEKVTGLYGHPELGRLLHHEYAVSGYLGARQKYAVILGEARRTGNVSVPASFIAEVYAELGEKESAFKWLEIAFQEHDEFLPGLKVDPDLDPLRSDPRFADLVRRVGLPP